MDHQQNSLWRRANELFLHTRKIRTGRALPHLEEMEKLLCLPGDKVLEDIHDLAEVEAAHKMESNKCAATHFSRRKQLI